MSYNGIDIPGSFAPEALAESFGNPCRCGCRRDLTSPVGFEPERFDPQNKCHREEDTEEAILDVLEQIQRLLCEILCLLRRS